MYTKNTPSYFSANIAKFLKYFSIVGFSLFVFIACNTNSLEPQSDSDDSEFVISSKEILSLCSNLDLPTNNSIKSGRVVASKRKIKNMKNIPDEEGKDVFYVINYEEGGFIIMSADKRTKPVLAHSLTGEFKFDSKIYPQGLASWLSSTKDYIKAVRKNGDKFKVNEKAWKEETIEKIVGNSSTEKIIGNSSKKSSRTSTEGCEPDAPCGGGGSCNDRYVVVNPLVSTNWGQWDGYNDQVPLMGCSNGSWNGRAPTGCVATAMAQVMNYHRRPIQYDWDNMQAGNAALTTLMRDIGQAVNMDYGCTESGASTENEAASSLTGDFQYLSAQYASYYFMPVMNELNNNRPVILRGGGPSGGHAWVCDGYNEYFFCDVGVGYLYLHMNWGWNGQNNGLYSFNNFNPPGFSYNDNRGMVYNIRP
jgi:Peptidase C10 family/Spi protease inhibitor